MRKYLYSHFKTISTLIALLALLSPSFAYADEQTLPATAQQCAIAYQEGAEDAISQDPGPEASKLVYVCKQGAIDFAATNPKPDKDMSQADIDFIILKMYAIAATAQYYTVPLGNTDPSQYKGDKKGSCEIATLGLPYAKDIVDKYPNEKDDDEFASNFLDAYGHNCWQSAKLG